MTATAVFNTDSARFATALTTEKLMIRRNVASARMATTIISLMFAMNALIIAPYVPRLIFV